MMIHKKVGIKNEVNNNVDNNEDTISIYLRIYITGQYKSEKKCLQKMGKMETGKEAENEETEKQIYKKEAGINTYKNETETL